MILSWILLNYNIFLALPFASFEGAEPEFKKINTWRFVIGILMIGILIPISPVLFSITRTFFDIFTPTGTFTSILTMLVLGIVVSALLFAVLNASTMIYNAIRKKPVGKQQITALISSLCIPLLVVLVMFGAVQIKKSSYRSMLENDRQALEIAVSARDGKVYADKYPLYYTGEIKGVSSSLFTGEELAQFDNITVITDPYQERNIFLKYGYLYSQISEDTAIYTSDQNVIRALMDQGYHLTGYYNTVHYVDLKEGPGGLQGARISLDVVSVGATVNIMMAATLLPGQTVIENAAKEPHIVDLANFLNTMGARISGAGTDTVKIKGVESLRGGTYAIIPDQIEAGTYLAAVAAAGGNVLVKNVIPKHMECITSKLQEMGATIINYDDSIRIMCDKRLRNATVKTRPYPGFPTDMQAQICVCMTLADGVSRLTESVYETRFFGYCSELTSMGADILINGKTAIVTGTQTLHGATVRAKDLRAGAALVIAGLAAEGTTYVENIVYIERGYERIVEKLSALGADIKRIEE